MTGTVCRHLIRVQSDTHPQENCIILTSSTKKTVDLGPLETQGWLSEQPAIFRDWVAQKARWREYAPGQVIYLAGDAADGLYGLGSGGLEISFPLISEEPVSIYRAEIGFWIGDSAELSKKPRMVSLHAVGATKLLHLPSRAVGALLAERPEHWQSFYELSARNVSVAMTLLAECLSLTVRARVCRRLLTLSEHDPNVEITQDRLARLVGVTRATLQRCIAELTAEGAVATGYRSLHVSDRAALKRYQDEQ